MAKLKLIRKYQLIVLLFVVLSGCGEKLEPLPAVEELKPQAELPDAMVMLDGQKVTTAEKWFTKRRPQIKRLFSHYMFGYTPPAPTNVAAKIERIDRNYFSGKATLKEVTITFGPKGCPPIHLLLVVPNKRNKPAPVFLGLNFKANHALLDDPAIRLSPLWMYKSSKGVVNNRASQASRGTAKERWDIENTINRGYAVATFYNGDIDPDYDDFSNGLHPYYYKAGQTRPGPNEWGTIAAWAWGLSKAVDYLVTDKDIDKNKIAVMGHSRCGKTALLAGAMDERIAMTISNQSGCGGAALSRRRMGETIKKINNRFGHWFNSEFKKFNDKEDHLPFDQHMLIALIAPRPVLVASAEKDLWADPQGEFLALKEADKVYRFLCSDGLDAESMPPVNTLINSRLGYHIRPGRHGVGPADWKVFCDFADKNLVEKVLVVK